MIALGLRLVVFAGVIFWAVGSSADISGSSRAAAPIERIHFDSLQGMPVIQVQVLDRPPASFVLDTGARPCVLDATYARELDLPITTRRTGQGGGGSFSADVISGPLNFKIAGRTLQCEETLSTDLSGVSKTIQKKIHGIVGGDFFRGRVVIIHYDTAVIAVHDRTTYRYRGSDAQIPIEVRGNRPYLMARLSVTGRENVARSLLIDTGSQDWIADSLLQESTDHLKDARGSGLGPGFATKSGTFSRVVIGPHEFSDVPGVIPAVPIVGAGLLGKFNLIFDYDGGWLVMEPRSSGRIR